MKKKLIGMLALCVILCLCVTGCFGGKEEPQGESTITPLLYRVTDEGGNVIWLFGSIHVGVESYYPLPDYVLDAFDGSDALAVELDVMKLEWNFVEQTELLQLMVYTDGTDITDHLPEATYTRAVEILQENGMYKEGMEYYIPAFWWSTVESLTYGASGAQTTLGIDRHLLKRARSDGKPVLEIESGEFQYGMMANFSPELQQLLLESAIASYDDPDATLEELNIMMELWATGDEEAFAAYLGAETEITNPEEEVLYREYTEALITSRNQSMTEYAVDALASGEEIFICVGAAHIVGQGAMAENLRQLGYQVELMK